MRRIAHAGECSEARNKRVAAEKYRVLASTPEGRAKLKIIRAKAHRRWREKYPEHDRARRAEWRNANRQRMAESNKAWVLANPEKVTRKNDRRRAILLDAYVEDVDRMELWERDKGICGICGEWIDPELPWPEKMSKTLDHVIPITKGGKHSWANAQIAHAVCNSRKNNHLVA